MKTLIQPAVLVVEDNICNQHVATLLLQKLGIAADLASDGRAALDAISRTHYGLVLLDYQMPVMDGLETLHAIRRCESTRELPVVMLTSDQNEITKRNCIKAGCNGFYSKPLTLEKLLGIIARWYLPNHELRCDLVMSGRRLA